ncbi:response regulator [Pseudomonas sp. MH2]|uniref:Response regulator n=1 Tax=Pseudomonas machongensis TaxID=3110229 RepID=A0ABU5VFT9_9PSED|nr:response regulator [Pseudomonas sp. MH2]MEA5672243.1 response regulator [Pseudomonas sp. MH2]
MSERPIAILIVEDEVPKSTQIELFLRGLCVPMHINTVRSVNSALDTLDENVPDLILLDMSLPTIDVDISNKESGGRAQGFGGVEVLRYMGFAGLACPTIVVTGYEVFPRETGDIGFSELREELKEDFPGIVQGVLHYNSTYETWKTELKAAFEAFRTSKGHE